MPKAIDVLSGAAPWAVDVGQACDWLAGLPSDSLHCAVTSPPYYGLRDYQADGQIGRERSPAEYVANLVRVFAELRRALHPTGTFWLNLGDSYANDAKGPRSARTSSIQGRPNLPSVQKGWRGVEGLKKKDLIGVPWMVAFALRADGWHLRSDCIWAKPNPMPESTADRPGKAHEYLFLFSKSPHYFYDRVAVLVPATCAGQGTARKTAGAAIRASQGEAVRTQPVGRNCGTPKARNLRSVWSASVARFKGAHFAVMPEKIVEPCIKAGTSERGCCPKCLKPWTRCVERLRVPTRPGIRSKVNRASDKPDSPYHQHSGQIVGNRDPQRHVTTIRTVGFQPSCPCEAGDPIPCVVADPFAGSGTVLKVAVGLGRRAVGCDLNAGYAEMARQRVGV